MKAVVARRYGSPDVLRIEEVEPPVPDADQVLVRVHASSVNAYDWHMLRGKPYVARLTDGFRRPKYPRVGLDVAGVVEAVGSGVEDLSLGDAVFGSRSGAFAELVAGRNFAPIPAGLTSVEAAALPTAGTTALQALRDQGRVRAGARVLVIGAGGGVGTLAIQIAKADGATVTAVTRSAHLDLVASLGADRVVDYTREDVTRSRERYEIVVDIAGTSPLRRLGSLLADDGRVVLVAPDPGQFLGPILRVVEARWLSHRGPRRFQPFLSRPSREALLALKDLVERGALRPVVERTYPLAAVAEAVRHVERGGSAGKVTVSMRAGDSSADERAGASAMRRASRCS